LLYVNLLINDEDKREKAWKRPEFRTPLASKSRMGKIDNKSFSLLKGFKNKKFGDVEDADASVVDATEMRHEVKSGDYARIAVDKLEDQEKVYYESLVDLTNRFVKVENHDVHGKDFQKVIATLRRLESLPKINDLFENNELCSKKLDRSSGMERIKKKGGVKELGGISFFVQL
jgi:hypothetical protein